MSEPEDRKAEAPWRWRRWRRGGAIVATCLAVLLHASPAAAADVDGVVGSATGVSVTGDLGVLPPTPTVGLSATESSPPAALGPFTAAAASVNLPSSLPFNVFSTGAMSVGTSAGRLVGDDDTGFVEAYAIVQNVVLGPNLATATSIASSCKADGRNATGTTVILGGLLQGTPFPTTPTPAPNTVVPVPGIGTVILNEQMRTSSLGSDGSTNVRIVVNAVHARFDSSGGGGILPVGQAAEAIIGQVTCEAIGGPTGPPQALPPPTTPPAPTTTLVVGTGPKLADTGADSMLPFAVLVLGLGGILGRAVRSASRRPT